MHLGHILLLSGMSLFIGIPLVIWTHIPLWIVIAISPVLALVSITLIDYLIPFLEKQTSSYDYEIKRGEELKFNFFRNVRDDINQQLASKRPCNKCGSTDVALIVYGLPDLDEAMKKMIDEKKITLGGCMIAKDSAKWACNVCKHTYGTLE